MAGERREKPRASEATDARFVVCQAGALRIGVPLADVVEVLRPLAIEPLAGAPAYVRGVVVLRGRPTPVVDLAALLGETTDEAPRRLLSVRVEASSGRAGAGAALAVRHVEGVRAVPLAALGGLPPLLRNRETDVVASLGVVDSRLLVVLREARIVPEAVWAAPTDTIGSAPGR
jgi:purine-binding chemotaxis protein CheW